MKHKKKIAGVIIGLSTLGITVLNGDCTGYDHKIPFNEESTWCIDDEQYTEAKDFIEKRIEGSTSYNTAYVIALLEYDSEFRSKLIHNLRMKQIRNNEIDADDLPLMEYYFEGIKEGGEYDKELKTNDINDLLPN